MALAAASACAQAQPDAEWKFGAVLDVTQTSRALALGGRDSGLQLGHSDLSAAGPVGGHLRAQLTATVATHEGAVEKGIEEAWLETTTLPAGLQLRAGRFASQIGYLNSQHPHADDFVERPLLYRAFFGGHWNDDGLRINWTAPTDMYWMFGVEALRGKRLVQQAVGSPPRAGVVTLVSKLGGDFDGANSWQLGLSHIRNRREAAVEDEHDHDDEQEHEHAHHHHGAQFNGRRTWMVDATWKWAPNGNNRERQLRVTFEAARIEGLNRHATSRDRQEANGLALVWRFDPSWEVGGRTDWLRVRMPHGEHFHGGLLREASLMLAWKPSHMQSLRLQYTAQRDAVEFENPSRRTIQLQYVLAFGAHGAHSF
ncbi:hypothetical protein [Piscinibacter sp.]|uniref:hypothetical protein n=1 Tax=Piscinibacter sp. TaxID=1903157 RepID=UPI0039E6CA49